MIYTVRNDLEIYKKKEFESIFIEGINAKGKNLIIGCNCRHPCMNLNEFIDVFMLDLLQKMSKKDKAMMLMGDFNIDLLKYDTNTDSIAFLDSMNTNFLRPYITTPTRVSTYSETLIDNIFLNNTEDGLVSGNIISTISDQFAQVLLQKGIKRVKKKRNLFRHNFKTLDKTLFDFELRQTDWNTNLEIDKKEIDTSQYSFTRACSFIINKITRSLNIFFCKESKRCYYFSLTIYSIFAFQRLSSDWWPLMMTSGK